nr:MAG TPA: hypothetical protein [Caudoviricetes sp.]
MALILFIFLTLRMKNVQRDRKTFMTQQKDF